MSPIIEFKNVFNEFKSGNHTINATDNVNSAINEKKVVVILKPLRTCKSTLLNLLRRLDSVTNGEINVNNQNAKNLNDNQLTEYNAKNVGFIFQFYNPIPNLTVLENVEVMRDIVDVDIEYIAVNECPKKINLEW